MKGNKVKKVFAIIMVVLIVALCVLSITGVGPIKPIQEQLKLGLDFKGGVYVVLEAQTDKTGTELKSLMEQTQAVIEERVNQMGLSEPVVTIEGEKRIRVELPGADDAEEAIQTIGKTAQLLFVRADGQVVLDGSSVSDAGVTKDEKGLTAISLEFDSTGASAFAEATKAALNGEIKNSDGEVDKRIYILLDDEVLSAPEVQAEITNGKAIITGSFTDDYAVNMARLIRAGALPVSLEEVETSVIGPSLGIDALKSSLIAGVIGVGLVFLFMLLVFKLMGVVADFALLLYIAVTFWILALFSAVLNLPGIAGIILAIGMAVDSNVIIFARIREEFEAGKTVRVATSSGFKRAFGTIMDSQITTLIAGVVLYLFGTGPVKGFAMTLMIGIIVSIISAVIVTQFLLKNLADTKAGTAKAFGLNTGLSKIKTHFDFIKHRKVYYIIACVIIVLGVGSGCIFGFNYGIDFTGGTMIQIELGQQAELSDVNDILEAHDITGASVVHAGEGNTQLIIKTTQSLDSEARQEILDDFVEKYNLEDGYLINAEQFSGSVGDMLKKNAIKSVCIAAACILLYIIIRFEWKAGVSAIVALLHDILMVVAFYAIFRIPINNPFIAGILTVVGYSINDTIVVFDRIRENKKGDKRHSRLAGYINESINQTLMRSIATSVTTIIAIIPLLILGGTTIREFVIPLMVGVTVGAISSIFVASPLYYDLDKLTNKGSEKTDYQTMVQQQLEEKDKKNK